MFDFIRSQFKVGDLITLHCNSGSYTGTIKFINEISIVLILKDGRMCGVKGDEINFFEEVATTTDSDQKTDTAVNSDPDKAVDSASLNSEATNCSVTPEHEDAAGTTRSSKSEDDSSSAGKQTSKYKVGDVIPLAELERIDPKVTRKNRFGGPTSSSVVVSYDVKPDTTIPETSPIEAKSSSKEKPKKGITIRGDFSGLKILVQDKHESDNQKIVPALGEVSAYYSDRKYGFIKDYRSKGYVFFHISQIVDNEIKDTIDKGTALVYTIQESSLGSKAYSIHRPLKVVSLLSMADSLAQSGYSKDGLAIVEHILAEYPDNFDADVLKNKLIKTVPTFQRGGGGYYNAYTKAKEYHNNKEYDKAIEYYRKAIEKGIRVDSAIKDAAALYSSMYKSEENAEKQEDIRQTAILFLAENVDKLNDNLSTWNFLEGVYYTLRDIDNFERIVNRILTDPSIQKDKKRRLILIGKKAAAYVREGRLDEAKKFIEECLKIDPNDTTALKLKVIINDGLPEEADIDDIISADVFSTISGELSPFIQDTINKYDEYLGVAPKDIDSGNFTTAILRKVRLSIDSMGEARAKERAKYLLTEAKLMMDLEPENIVKLRSELAKYCIAMALNHISVYSAMDIPRFYYNEAFALDDSSNLLRRHVSRYLLTHCYQWGDLLSATNNDVPLDQAITSLLEGGFIAKRWDSILSMMLFNRSIFAGITSRLYSRSDWRAQSIKALEYFGANTSNINCQDDFVSAWSTARSIRLREYKQLVTQIKSICSSSNIEEFNLSLLNLQQIKKDWMTDIDTARFFSIIHNIHPAIDSYIKSSGYRGKEINYNNAQGQIQQLIEEIDAGPTKLSYEAISPLLSKVKSVLFASFNDVIKASEPKIKITLLSSEIVISENGTVKIQVLVENHKDSSPIREVSVQIESSDDVEFIPSENIYYNSIEGGESQIFILQLKVSQSVIDSKAAAINAICNYKNGDSIGTASSLLSLKLYSPDDFAPIDNPYAPVADGGPIPVESKMFYGREEFIANRVEAIIKSPSKQIIIYGQKRCGKSSVLNHLKQKLIETGKTFCILFSLGDIIQNLTEATFYHKILKSIEDELEGLQFEGQTVPEFTVPKLSDFKLEDEENPLNTFTSYMTKFKRACKVTPGWEDKNLVVMIDEFTYLYTEIKENHISDSIMKQWKAVTQNAKAQFSVVLVGQDVVPSFKKEDYARNAFGVIEDIRLTYLNEEPARELIEKPILDENGNSRYVGNAVSRIIDYTSRNPYYIQIFCARLVNYMNSNKSIMVTEADVNEVAKSFVVGDQALEEDKFDNLIRAGEKEDLQEYPESEIKAVLRAIATVSKNIGFCNRSDLNALDDKQREDDILKHLVDREVLEKKGEESYKIQVKLFQEWLLNH